MKHVISIEDFSIEQIESLCQLTDQIIASPENFREALANKVIATLFYEPSTRTRLSFEAAIQRLGGSVISTENARELSSAVKGENLEDTIQVVQGYADGIVLRHFDDHAASSAASVAQVPIINAGSGSLEHPTQALLDLYTIYSIKGGIENQTVLVSGDLLYGRTVHSLVKKLAHYPGIVIYGLSNPGLALPQEYVDYLQAHEVPYIPCTKLEEVGQSIDVIYHTRTQLERFTADGEISEIIIDQQALDYLGEQAILMHPLPRNQEIAPEVDQDDRAVFFTQSRNGMYVRMALLCQIFS